VASTLDTLSVRAMVAALIAGERDPKVLAGLARGRMKAKHAALVEALTGRFDDHHAELARMLLDQIDALTAQIGTLTTRIEQLLAAIPAAQGVDADGTTGPGAGTGPGATVLPAVARLDEVTGIGRDAAQVILAELGLDMGIFRTPAHLVSWARLCPRTIQSGATNRAGKTGKGNPYLKGILGEAAAAAARTDTFLGERYRRLVKRRGKLKALVAVARSILVIVWHLLADPAARTTIWAPATTPAASTRTRRPATTSASWKPSGSPSPSPRPPDPASQPHRVAGAGFAGRCRLPHSGPRFSGQGTDHRPAKERQRRWRRYLRTGGRPRAGGRPGSVHGHAYVALHRTILGHQALHPVG
jgi:Transposase IS116/IS110/IS902 family